MAEINPGKWAFFGGLNEAGGTPTECLIREMKEELGLDLMSREIRPLFDYYNQEARTHDMFSWSTSSYRAVNWSSGKVRTARGSIEIR